MLHFKGPLNIEKQARKIKNSETVWAHSGIITKVLRALFLKCVLDYLKIMKA